MASAKAAVRAATDGATVDVADKYPDVANRANWLEQRMATMDTRRKGLAFDEREYAQLCEIFRRLGMKYTPGPYAAYGRGEAAAGEEMEPPYIGDGGCWTPGSRASAEPPRRLRFRQPGRYLPRGSV